MRILVCSIEYPPLNSSGIGNVVFNICNKLYSKNKDIHIDICSPNGPDIKLGNSFLINRIPLFGILLFWFKVSSILEKKDYDVIWLHNPIILFKNKKDNVVITYHTTYYGGYKNNLYPKIYYYVAKNIEKISINKYNGSEIIIGVNNEVRRELLDIGIKNNIITIRNGVDTDKYIPKDKSLRKKYGIPQDSILILSVGRLTSQKRPLLLLEIMKKIIDENKNIYYVIVGKGELSSRINSSIDSNRIILLGYVEENKKIELYGCSDYYIISSSYEGDPLTLLEALSAGLPCITSDINNFEIVKESCSGIMINFEDINVHKNILNFINKKNHNNFAFNSRSFAKKYLDWSIISDLYYNIFTDVIK